MNAVFQSVRNGSNGLYVPMTSMDAITVTAVVVSPSSATVTGGGTQQFTAVVQGTGGPSQAVTWAMVSGVGTIVNGLYTAPAATSSTQTGTFKATSTQDNTYSGSVTVAIPALTVAPRVALYLVNGRLRASAS